MAVEYVPPMPDVKVDFQSKPIPGITNESQNYNQETAVNAENSDTVPTYKDSKRAWMVVLAGFLIQVFIVGVLHAFGVFFVQLVEEFHTSKAAAAWVGSGSYGISMFLGPIISYYINQYGNAPVAMLGCLICSVSLLVSSFAPSIAFLYVFFSVFFGTGCCMAYTPTMCLASSYFDKHITLATGLMVAGSSSGALVLSPLCQLIIDAYGWRNAFRFLSLTALLMVLCAMQFKPLPVLDNQAPVTEETTSEKLRVFCSLWKSRVFVVWTLAIFSVQFGYYIPYVHLMAHAQDIGISADRGSVLIMLLGGTTAFGRILFGKLLGLIPMNRIHLHQLSMTFNGTALMLLPLIRTFGGLVTYVLCVGIVDGLFVDLLPINNFMLLGQDQMVAGWGFLNMLASITFMLGPPCAGWLYDAYGNYDIAFHIAGLPIIFGAVILFFIPWAKRHSKKSSRYAVMVYHAEGSDTDYDGASLSSSNESVLTVRSLQSFVTSQQSMATELENQEVKQRQLSRPIDIQNSAHSSVVNVATSPGGVLPESVTEAINVYKRTSYSLLELEKTADHCEPFDISSKRTSVMSLNTDGEELTGVNSQTSYDQEIDMATVPQPLHTAYDSAEPVTNSFNRTLSSHSRSEAAITEQTPNIPTSPPSAHFPPTNSFNRTLNSHSRGEAVIPEQTSSIPISPPTAHFPPTSPYSSPLNQPDFEFGVNSFNQSTRGSSHSVEPTLVTVNSANIPIISPPPVQYSATSPYTSPFDLPLDGNDQFPPISPTVSPCSYPHGAEVSSMSLYDIVIDTDMYGHVSNTTSPMASPTRDAPIFHMSDLSLTPSNDTND